MVWKVVTVDGQVLFALTPDGYEALSHNTADTIRWVKEAAWQLDFYYRNRRSAAPAQEASK